MVALALFLSGLGTLVLVGRSARDETRRELVTQARDIADQATDAETFLALARASRALRLEGLSRVAVTAGGVVEGQLPAGITVADLQPARLRGGATVSGTKGSLAYAAVGVRRPNQRVQNPAFIAVVLTRQADSGLRRGFSWLLVSSGLALVVAAIVADRLSRRITAPLAQAEAATRRIAAGDLAARLPETGADPELTSLARSINALAANLDRSRGLERQFLLAVSHDLRTPLTSIRGFAEAISDGVEPDHVRAAEVIAAESRRLERLVGDLLDLARLDARRFSLDVRRVDVAEVAGVTAEGFRPELATIGIELGVAVPAGTANGPVTASADPERLAQVVANLVENGLKFATTRIDVAVRSTGDGGALIVVGDDGPGIAPDDLPHVFDRLYTSARHPARRSGSGLGLAIVSELVAAMGGSVRAVSSGGSGTQVEVRLRPWTTVGQTSAE